MSHRVRDVAGVVLAGGRSTRMGADKALLRLPDGRTLLERQVELLQQAGAEPCLVSVRSGQARTGVPPRVQVVEDPGDAGPLGGIVAALRACGRPRLLVVAVDLPRLDVATLAWLDAAAPGGGAVARHDGRLEPLAAVYPQAWLPVAEAALARREFSLQALLQSAGSRPHFRVVEAPVPEVFTNWNRPADFIP